VKATAVSATGLKSVTRGRKQTPFVQWRLAGNVNTVGSGTDDLATIEEGATMLGEGVDPVWDEPLPDMSVPGDLLLRARASKAGQSTGVATPLSSTRPAPDTRRCWMWLDARTELPRREERAVGDCTVILGKSSSSNVSSIVIVPTVSTSAVCDTSVPLPHWAYTTTIRSVRASQWLW